MNEIGAFYGRTSFDERDNPRESIQNQELLCFKKAEENGDRLQKENCYRDIGRSGTEADNRKEFQKMILEGLESKFTILYILNISRFGRDLGDQEHYLKKLRKVGIKVYSVDEGLLDDKNTLMRQFKGMLNEETIRVMRRETERQHKIRLIKKMPVSRPPFGYKKNYRYNTKKEKIIINKSKDIHSWIIYEKESLIVKEIFRLKLEGKTAKEISLKVQKSYQTINNILSNISYIGNYKYRDEIIEKAHEPIITEEDFKNANK